MFCKIPEHLNICNLGNVGNYKLVKNVFKEFSVDVVFHAAAYKHVPMVEANPLEGIANNFYSTKVICELL